MVTGEESARLTSICLFCRTLMSQGERCDVDSNHEVVNVHERRGRAALVREIWHDTPRSLRSMSVEARMMTTFVLGPAMFMLLMPQAAMCQSVGRLPGLNVALVNLLLVVGILLICVPPARRFLLWLLMLPVQLIRRPWRQLLRPGRRTLPRGTLTLIPGPTSGQRWRGTIQATTTLTAPVSGETCAAFSTSYCNDTAFGGPILLIETCIVGCVLQLDDGRTVRILPGRVRMEGGTARRHGDPGTVSAHISSIHETLPELVPCDHVSEITLHNGDTVTLIGDVTDVTMSYRESGRGFSVTGIPRIILPARHAPTGHEPSTSRQHIAAGSSSPGSRSDIAMP